VLKDLRILVYEMHLELPKNNLVVSTSGNASAIDQSTGYVVIKPSGVAYDKLSPNNLVIVDLNGNIVEGDLKPSVDCETHLRIYKDNPSVGGVVHTHSPFATAFAVHGKEIPVICTAMADEFGAPIPCAPYQAVGGDGIGRIVASYSKQSPVVLMERHGLFSIGGDLKTAIKRAIIAEDIARLALYSSLLGPLSAMNNEVVKSAHNVYISNYGQR
jgi:L-ribulose-5-phosphate 4-epimerase